MSLFTRELDPYKWRYERLLGRRVFLIRRGILPGFVAGLVFAALMILIGNENSVFINGIGFTIATLPIYFGMAWVMWETNEDAFAQWVADEARRLDAASKKKRELSA